MLCLLWEEEIKPTSFHFHRARSSLPLPFRCLIALLCRLQLACACYLSMVTIDCCDCLSAAVLCCAVLCCAVLCCAGLYLLKFEVRPSKSITHTILSLRSGQPKPKCSALLRCLSTARTLESVNPSLRQPQPEIESALAQNLSPGCNPRNSGFQPKVQS
eukprot:m.210987 g.210987  ORF g.210987 m.210987 type:complete len:159 (+) comp17146_c1_seq48:1516-1992(+)